MWRDGCNVLLRGTDRRPVSWNGMGTTPLASVGDVTTATTEPFLDIAQHPTIGPTFVKMSTGSASTWRNNTLFYCGSGAIYFGSSTSFDTASSTLKVRLASGSTLTVGMQAPTDAPVLAASGMTSLKLTGTRSCVFWEVSSITGWRSNRSPVSNIVTFLNKKAIVTFPLLINTGAGADAFEIAFTPAGLGTGNAFFELPGTIMNASLPANRQVVFDFNDNDLDLTRPAPVTKDPPPTGGGSHVVGFDATVVLCGTYAGSASAGGAGISPADLDSNGGSYDPLKTNFASPFEAFSAMWPRPSSGFAMFTTAHSLQALYVVGGPFIVAVRSYWGNEGIPGGRKSGCFANQNFLCYTSNGPAMLNGDSPDPDYTFALPVQDLMARNFNAKTVTVGWEPKDKLGVYCGFLSEGIASGNWVAIPYRFLDGTWSPPCILPGQPKGAITLNGQLYLMIGGALLPWNMGSSNGGWYLRGTATFRSAGRRFRPRRMTLSGTASTIKARIYTNLDFTGTPAEVSSGNGNVYGPWKKMLPSKKAQFGIELYGPGIAQSANSLQIEGWLDPNPTR